MNLTTENSTIIAHQKPYHQLKQVNTDDSYTHLLIFENLETKFSISHRFMKIQLLVKKT